MKKLIVAIDGPAGAGKSTVARSVAQRLNYTYIDTGAMYRAVTWALMQRGVPVEDTSQVIKIAEELNLMLTCIDGRTVVRVDEVDITEAIRTPEVSRLVSLVSQIGRVREAMVGLQRQMADLGGVVMDGRDIGTHVLPNADIKIFLTASIEERARRRWRELCDKGYKVDFDELKNDIACRDKADCERDIAPLLQAKDAILVDTTEMSIAQAVEHILLLCEERARDL